MNPTEILKLATESEGDTVAVVVYTTASGFNSYPARIGNENEGIR